MGLFRTILTAGLLALILACDGAEADRVAVVSVHGTETSSSGGSSGGGTIQVSGSALEVEGRAWTFDEPEAFVGRIPPARLVAIGDAMFRAGPDAEVVDALLTDRGTVALIRRGDGQLALCHYEAEPAACSRAPDGARRILVGTADPFTVRLLIADDLAVTATRTGE